MFLEAKTTSLIDSLEIAVVKFLNSITERYSEPRSGAWPRHGTARSGSASCLIASSPEPSYQQRNAPMASSKLAARAIRNHAKYKGRNDLNIVPMIDMMVILVFFLLFTAVFSNTNILELNLPAPNSSVPDLPKGLQLEVHRAPEHARHRRSQFGRAAIAADERRRL